MESLKLPVVKSLNKWATERRLRTIAEAVGWLGNIDSTMQNLTYHELWRSEELNASVCVGKFGKEYYSNTIRHKDGSLGNNPNDMCPTILINGNQWVMSGSFMYVFDLFQKIHGKHEDALNLLGCVLARNAYLVDHVEDENGNLRYAPPADVVAALREMLGEIEGLDIEVFLHYLDTIALNEDVKYNGLGYDIGRGIGRRNNLLTCVHIIAVFLGRRSLVKLCGSFSRPPAGIASMSLKAVKEAFPMLT